MFFEKKIIKDRNTTLDQNYDCLLYSNIYSNIVVYNIYNINQELKVRDI